MRADLRPVTLPTFVTCGNLAAGFLALLQAIGGNFFQAALLVSAAAVLDSLDGSIARRSGTEDEFGSNLDSLADIVSFGVAPSVALYLSLLYALPNLGVVACVAYVVCGTLRLARFPMVKDLDHFVGLPIPPAGLLLVWVAAVVTAPPVALLLALVAGALMISGLPFPRRPLDLLRRKSFPDRFPRP